MHTYGGNDAAYPVSISLGDDGVDPPAFTTFNTPPTGLADRAAWLRRIGLALDWHASQSPAVGVSLVAYQAIAWDPLTLKWLVAGNDSAGTPGLWVVTGRGDSTAWTKAISTSVTTSTGFFNGIVRGNEPSVSSKYFYATFIESGALILARGDTVGNAWATFGPGGAGTDFLKGRVISHNGVIVVASGASSSGDSQLFFSSNHGVTWTAQSSLVIGVAVTDWLLAQSVRGGGQILAIPTLANFGYYLVSSNGSTWLSASLAGVIGTTEFPTGLTWADDGNGVACWVLATTDGTIVRTYRSYDGLTWSSVANNLGSTDVTSFESLAFCNGILAASVFESSPARILYSLNGGATWDVSASIGGSSAGSTLAAGPNGFICNAFSTIMASRLYGNPGGVGTR